MRWLDQLEVEALGEEHEVVEEVVGQHDVVVDHHQPVVRIGGMGGEQAVEVLKLPALTRRAEMDLDLVARARKLRADRAGQRTPLGTLDAEYQHAPARGRAARGAIEAQAPAVEQLAGIHHAVEELAPRRVETPDGAAFAGEEIVGLALAGSRAPRW